MLTKYDVLKIFNRLIISLIVGAIGFGYISYRIYSGAEVQCYKSAREYCDDYSVTLLISVSLLAATLIIKIFVKFVLKLLDKQNK